MQLNRSCACARHEMLAIAIALIVVSGCSEPAGRSPEPADARPDIVLITIDTLRADHLELYGYSRNTAPRISALGQSGIVFMHASSQAPWTLPSLASLHTGLLPSRHGAVLNSTPIGPEHQTIAEVLSADGYHTAGVSSHVFAGARYGFSKGFRHFDARHTQGHTGTSSQQLTEVALSLFEPDIESPIFLWVHYFDPHYSYLRHPEYGFATGPSGRFGKEIHFASPDGSELHSISPSERQYMIDVFDEEISYTDHHIGALIDGIRASERTRPIRFLLTADHGEAFLERGRLAHGKDVYDELIHVPLVIAGDLDPALRGLRVEFAVEVASLATTITGMAGIDPNPFPGVDLIDTASGKKIPDFVFSEGSYARGRDSRTIGVERGRWKLIHHLDSDRYELFNRESDPQETKNLYNTLEGRMMRDKLESALKAHSRPVVKAGGPIELSEEERSKLRALGYIDQP